MRRLVCLGLTMTVAVLALPHRASAQAARLGPTFSLGGTAPTISDPDVAHDSVTNRYLKVSGKSFIEAHLLNAAGTPIAAFRVNATGEYAQTPRVAYSPDVAGGAYLVTWHASIGNFTRVRGRLFRGDGVPLTADFDISDGTSGATSSNWTMGAAVAYASGSKEFLVAWMGNYGWTNDIFFRRVNTAGTPVGAPTLVSGGTADWDRDPSVSYNPYADEFMVAYAGYNEGGRYGFTAARRVKAGSGQMPAPATIFGAAVATYVPAVTFDTASQTYLVGWYNRVLGGASVYGVTLRADGLQIGDIRVLSPHYAAYDALDIDYNPPSGQSLLVTHGGGNTPWEDAAVSILPSGHAYDNGFIVTNTQDVRGLRANPGQTEGNYNPRLTTSLLEKKWLMVTSSNFAAIHAQFAYTDASGGGAPPPPPPPAGSSPMMSLDLPSANSTVQGSFQIAGWAVDLGSPDGPGVSAVHVWAFPASGGAPTFLGPAALGHARPDVAGALGGARFTTSGFNLGGSLPPGTYDVRAYALSTVANTFNNSAAARITIAAPVSRPYMWVDGPAQNQTITQTFSVAGWAVDLAAPSGVGVDAIHVWAYPISGAAPMFVGAGTVGGYRPDVAAAFVNWQFMPSGFTVAGSLPPGEYNLVVFSHSSVTGTFNQAILVRIRVV